MGGKVSTGKMAAVTRVVQTNGKSAGTGMRYGKKAVRPRAPLIKFPDRQSMARPNVEAALKLLNFTIPQTSPPAAATSTPPAAPRPAAAVSRLPASPESIAIVKELPQRYRRRELALEEMDYIQRGGPE